MRSWCFLRTGRDQQLITRWWELYGTALSDQIKIGLGADNVLHKVGTSEQDNTNCQSCQAAGHETVRLLWKPWGEGIARQSWNRNSQWIAQEETSLWKKPPQKEEFLGHRAGGPFMVVIWDCTSSMWLHPPVNEVLLLQVLHSRGDLGGHVE